MRELILLGATGSIGTQSLEIIKNNDIRVKAIAIGSNYQKAIDIIKEFNIEYVCCKDEFVAKELNKMAPNIKTSYGISGLKEIVTIYDGDVLNAISGTIGVVPTIEAIKNNKNVLLANKESMVVAGEIINKLSKENNVKIIPIDSEHNALYRLINSNKRSEIKNLIITASGGAFRDLNRSELSNVKISDALTHPNWNMGNKITVDCATMANKGLEVIEAHYLFNIDYDNILTCLHKESIIHAMVEFNDNSIEAVMYNPSMLVPIQHAILGEFKELNVSRIDFDKIKSMTFKDMDFERYPLIKLAYKVGKLGGLYPCVYNSANEACVKLFMENKISFLDIEKIVESEVENFTYNKTCYNVDDILDLDKKIKDSIYNRGGKC